MIFNFPFFLGRNLIKAKKNNIIQEKKNPRAERSHTCVFTLCEFNKVKSPKRMISLRAYFLTQQQHNNEKKGKVTFDPLYELSVWMYP